MSDLNLRKIKVLEQRIQTPEEQLNQRKDTGKIIAFQKKTQKIRGT